MDIFKGFDIMKMKYWKTNKMNVSLIGRTEDKRFPIIKLLEPIYKTAERKIIAYNIGTEIVVTDDELISPLN